MSALEVHEDPSNEQTQHSYTTPEHSPAQGVNLPTLSTPSRRYAKKEEVIQQLRVAVVGPDSDYFMDKLVETFPKFTSEDKSSSREDDPCASYLGKVRGQLVLFVDVGGLESESNSIPRQCVIQSLLSRVTGGLHMVILNIRAGTSEANVKKLINRFTCMFGEDVMKYTLIAFSDSSLLSRYNKDVITYSRNLPDDIRCLLRIPIGKEAVWAFDKQDSREAFAIEIEQLTFMVDTLAKNRPKKERYFKADMIPNIDYFHEDGDDGGDNDDYGDDDDDDDNDNIGGDGETSHKGTIGEILSKPLRRARDICVIA
ncbi:uncharacterized protein [Amphiura filiformis]|uniref:uncharacterized protein n=1 Tax=Amphiura filiformis TaxID=82378 RepID=UPI003B217333